MGQAVHLDKTKKQWADLGVLFSKNCLVKPSSCPKASLSVWLDIFSCTTGSLEGVLSSFVAYGEGISLECSGNQIQYVDKNIC